MTEGTRNQKQAGFELKTFPVPFALELNKENFTITTHTSSKPSKEELINQAFKFHSEGNIQKAAKYYKYFIDQGFKDQRVFSNYGDILKNIGNLQEAELTTRKAIELKPNYAQAHSNLGNILNSIGNLEEAELSYRKAIELKPDFPEAHSNLGSILKDLGKLQDAELSTRKAIELKPDYVEAHYNLGIILNDLGKLQDAELSTRKAIELNPNLAYAHFNLGCIYKDLYNLKEAEISTRKAIELKPDFGNAYYNLGVILRELVKEKEAIRMFDMALEIEPNNITYITSKFYFSRIMRDILHINVERKNYAEQIYLLKSKDNIDYNSDIIFSTNSFYLPYHNRSDDRVILEELSTTISEIKGLVVNDFSIDKKINSSSINDHLKVGICSEFLRYSHVIGKLYIKVLLDLLKTDLEIIIYIPAGTKIIKEFEILKKSFKRIVFLPKSPTNAMKQIINDNLDILFYPDIGMSNYTYIMALSRLALVQVNSLGHTNTSGMKTIDYFITSNVEPITSQDRYTENLIRFSRLPFNYSKPIINESKIKHCNNNINSKEFFNIGLTQTLFKLHPDNDQILEEILNEIPKARLILVKDKNNSVTELLKDRWRHKNILLLERSIFLDRMSNNDFLNVIKNCDIMLDPLYYGSGNTFYESMAFGIPFITHKNQKSKIPIAGYKQMKINNPPIATSDADYINWCKIYSNDKNLLTKTSKDLIEKSNQYLFYDNNIYKQYYEFFNEAVKAAKKGKSLSSAWSP